MAGIDWVEFRKKAKAAAENAGAKTDEQLASTISSVTRFTDEEIQKLFPVPADAEKLAELMSIVKSATDRNQKVAKVQEQIGQYAGIVVTLLEHAV